MRRKGNLAAFAAGIVALIGGMFVGSAPIATAAPADSLIGRLLGDSADSTAAWLPSEPAELDAPDRLEERDSEPGFGARVDLREGRLSPRHLWVEERWPAGRIRAAWVFTDGRAGSGTVLLRPARWLAVAGGAIVTRRPPSLLGEAVGLVAPQRAPRSPALESPDLETPRGSSSRAVRGAALTLGRRDRAGASSLAVWAIAGRDLERRDVLAGGVSIRGGAGAIAAAAGDLRGSRRGVSLAAESGRSERRVAGEVLVAPERGPEFLAEAVRASGPLRVETRWRRRPGDARSVSGELRFWVATAWTRARLTWRPWSARATGDDGKVELETSGPGPIRIRFGSRGGDLDGAATTSDGATGRRERYAIADLLIARERRRSVSILASVRETRGPSGRSVGSSIGGRLVLSSRGRGGATLLMQARRAVANGPADAEAPAAWTTSIAPSGEEWLASRAGSGIVASGRAWLRLGGLRFEALVSDVAPADEERPASASLRVQWERRDQRNGSP